MVMANSCYDGEYDGTYFIHSNIIDGEYDG